MLLGGGKKVSKYDKESFFKDIEDLFSFFNNHIVSVYNKVVVLTAKKPLPFLIEIEACFFHLARAFEILTNVSDKSGDEERERVAKILRTNIQRARGHLERLGLDGVKLLWELVYDNLTRLYEENYIEAKDYNEFIKLSIDAREKETKRIGDSSKEEIIKAYEKAINKILKKQMD